MAIVTYPLNGILYQAADAELYNSTRTSGVYALSSNLDISITGARQVTISTGMAWIKSEPFTGKAVAVLNAQALTIDAASSTLDRIDRVVLQFSKNDNLTRLIVKKGTAASNPVPPARSTTAALYELVLYDIRVPHGVASIAAAHITDQRANSELCGLMRDGVDSLNPPTVGLTVSIPASAWSESASDETWRCTISNSAFHAGQNVVVSAATSSADNLRAWDDCAIRAVSVAEGSMTFAALSAAPEAAVTANVIIVGG